MVITIKLRVIITVQSHNSMIPSIIPPGDIGNLLPTPGIVGSI